MSDYIIETHDLTKKYGNQNSVSHLNIHVKKGRIYGLLGRNGAGKTTTMRMLLGLTAPTSGEVEIFGKPIHGNEKEILPRIGCLIESPGFYPNLTGTENFCRPAGIEKPAIHQKCFGSCQPALPGQEIIFAIFSRYEAAFSYCIGHHPQSRTVDFG